MINDDRKSKMNVLVISAFLISIAIILAFYTQSSTKVFAEDNNGNWIAPVYVQDQGKVLNGTFILSPLDLTALGTSKIPPEMAKYRSAYAKSLQWLAAFVPKPGQSLNAGSWGKIASIGGPEIKPAGHKELNIPAFPEPIDTTRIEYYLSLIHIS